MILFLPNPVDLRLIHDVSKEAHREMLVEVTRYLDDM